MSNVFEIEPSQTRVLNAKRYGLSADDLNRFTEIMTGLREQDGSVTSLPVQETDEQRTERIKDYMISRITGHLSSLYMPDDRPTSVEDMMFDLMSPRDDKDSGWSTFLNVHFDLDTLQMLNKL